MRLTLFAFCTVLWSFVCGQSYVTVDAAHAGLDTKRNLLLVRLDLSQQPDDMQGVRIDEEMYTFDDPPARVSYETGHPASTTLGDSVTVYFTQLPLFVIRSYYELNEETKVPSVVRYADDEQVLSSISGIEYRGGFTLGYPKRSLDLEFWNNATDRESVDVRFGSFREDDDWVLDALYNEPMRVNAYVAHKLWLDWHELSYADEEPEARSGAEVRLVEVFFQDEYYGVCMLSEQIDRKQLQLKKLKDDRLRGELYKGFHWSSSTMFTGQPPLPGRNSTIYDSWELKYPDGDDLIDWSRLYDMLGFVTYASDEDFRDDIFTRFVRDNLIDYILFINVAALFDNTGKNTYLARYDEGHPYFYVPWDLDGSFGNYYDGTRAKDTEFWLTNGLFDRVSEVNPDHFNQQVCNRYRELRSGMLATDRLIERLEDARLMLEENGVYARENMRWGNARNDSDQVDFTEGYVRERMAYLDQYVCSLTSSSEPASDTSPISVFPNPAKGSIQVTHGSNSPLPYRIVGTTGQVMMTGTASPLTDRIEIEALRPGVYILQVGGHHRRFVVQ